ncbi:tetratricopeptide repeat protein [Dongia sp.]|uniref:tetratricopeptide repeat protein n=1 Tax=Dongia sp. TaxID=1977262 RepID=UPI0035AFE9CF
MADTLDPDYLAAMIKDLPESGLLRKGRRYAAVSLLALAMALPAMGARAQDAVATRGQLFDDYGRLTFTWPKAAVPKVDVALSAQAMVLRFARPVALDTTALRADLKAYIRTATLSADKMVLTLALKKPVTYRLNQNGERLQLDLAQPGEAVFPNKAEAPAAPPASTTSIPATPAEPSAAPAGGPKLKLRSGEHSGYSRLAIDWPGVDFSVRQEGDKAIVTFAKQGQLDTATKLPPRLRGVSAKSTASGGLVLELQLLPNIGINAFRNGDTIVFDLVDGKGDAAAPEPAPAAVVPVPAEPPVAEEPPAPSAVRVPEYVPALQSEPPVGATEPETAPVPAPAVEIAPPVVVSKEAAVTKAAQPPAPVEILASAAASENGAVLNFGFPKATGLAVFKRGDALWMVFDRPGPVDVAGLVRSVPALTGLARIETPYATALRLPGLDRLGGANAGIAVSGDGRAWQVSLGPGRSMRPAKTIDQRRESLADGGASLLLQAARPGPVISLNDPEAGDSLSVIPLVAAGTGVAEGAAWPDFRVLPSFQGVVVVPISDRTRVEALPNGVVVTTDGEPGAPPSPTVPQPIAETEPPPIESGAPATVAAAPEAAPEAAPSQPVTETSSKVEVETAEGIFDLPRWRRGGEAEFGADEKALRAAIDETSNRDKPQARLALAQFHFAHGRYPEAVEDMAQLDKLAADGDKDVLALRGAAQALMDRAADAHADLDRSELDGVPEAVLFRGYIAARDREWESATTAFSAPIPDIDDYPKTARMLIRRAAAEALIRGGNALTAQAFLDSIRLDMPNAEDEDYRAYLDGLQLAGGGKKDEAIGIWAGLIDSPVEEVRARSQFDMTELQLSEGKIDVRQATKQMEALRFLWRGTDFEFNLLNRLGQLYVESDQPRKGLVTLRQAAANFPKNPKAKDATEAMTKAFRDLYLGDKADRLPPLTAVALYDEFRELTPSGVDGDRMVTALADRLVKVDLLDGAATLLENQIAKRLSGLDKAKAGTRLAAIRLLDGKPELALEAIKASEVPDIPPDLMAQRRRLQGRALFETGDTLKGMALVRSDNSLDGLWLKADLTWRMREWPAAAQALEALVAEETKRQQDADPSMRPPPDLAVDPAAALAELADDGAAAAKRDAQFNEVLAPLILNQAVALSLSNDRPGLRMLAKAHGKQMATGPYATAFQTLTSPSSSLSDSISAAMKSVDQLGAFVDDYRERLKKESLSAPETEADAVPPPESAPAP